MLIRAIEETKAEETKGDEHLSSRPQRHSLLSSPSGTL